MHASTLQWLREYNFLIFDEVDSTNLEAKRLVDSRIDDKFIIWSKKQTHGKGKRNSKWSSLEGNLFFSVIDKLDFPIHNTPQLSFITGLAIRHGIRTATKEQALNFDVKLKWPNDIIINDKKVGGVLLESAHCFNDIDSKYVIIGVGINVNKTPRVNKYTPSCLKEEGAEYMEVDFLLDKIMSAFSKYYNMWKEEGFIKLRELWLNHAYRLNSTVTIKSGKNRISGKYKDIDFNGKIRIQLAGGTICSLSAGELIFENQGTLV